LANKLSVVKQLIPNQSNQVNGTVILPPLVFPGFNNQGFIFADLLRQAGGRRRSVDLRRADRGLRDAGKDQEVPPEQQRRQVPGAAAAVAAVRFFFFGADKVAEIS
jgi:hypothetical protein